MTLARLPGLVRSPDAGRLLDATPSPQPPDEPAFRAKGTVMRRAAEQIELELDVAGIVTRGEDWGGQLVRHVRLPAGADFTPLFKGLPGDMCQCPHWGVVIEGAITLRYTDGREETCQAGDLYYWPGGHTGWTDDGVTFIEFSPAEQLRPVLEHVGAQLVPTS